MAAKYVLSAATFTRSFTHLFIRELMHLYIPIFWCSPKDISKTLYIRCRKKTKIQAKSQIKMCIKVFLPRTHTYILTDGCGTWLLEALQFAFFAGSWRSSLFVAVPLRHFHCRQRRVDSRLHCANYMLHLNVYSLQFKQVYASKCCRFICV